ncbi:MAG: tol-pal system protein YbgF [Thiotrichaceae bacterium]
MRTQTMNINRITLTSIIVGLFLSLSTMVAHAAPDDKLVQELAQKVDALGREIDQLRGENEKLNYELGQLKSNQKKGFLAIDERLEKKRSVSTPAKPVKPVTQGAQTKPPVTVATKAVPAKPTAKPKPVKPTQKPASSKPTPTKTSANGEKAEYNNAYQTLKGDRQAGINAFTAFLAKYPTSPLAENAHYWIGEAKYAKKNYKGAIDSFVVVLNKYKSGRKAPDAAVKLGYSFYALKDWTLARRTFNDVLRYFPGSNAAKLAQARLDRMQKEGH